MLLKSVSGDAGSFCSIVFDCVGVDELMLFAGVSESKLWRVVVFVDDAGWLYCRSVGSSR